MVCLSLNDQSVDYILSYFETFMKIFKEYFNP